MKRSATLLLSVLLALCIAATSAPTTAPSTKAAPQRANVAAPKLGADGKVNKTFEQKHESFVQQAKAGNIDVLFLGDSITAGWAGGGKDVWKQHYEKLHAANFGISGDRTQHVLWRIENGELENIHPKVAVIMIGTNNLNSNPTDEIIAGIERIVTEVRDKTGAKVLLLGIFPRGETPESGNRERIKINQINDQIKHLDDGKNVRYLDLTSRFIEPDMSISKEVMRDFLHPTAKGYQIWAEGMDPLLNEMLNQK